jgi:hypothetical protein
VASGAKWRMPGRATRPMPRRKSKNTSSSAVFSRAEAERTGYGSARARLGKESQLAFGQCGLCLQDIKARERIAVSPSGTLYHRNCIVEYIYERKMLLKEAVRREEAASAASASKPSETTTTAHSETATDRIDRAMAEQRKKVDTESLDRLREEAKANSFWMGSGEAHRPTGSGIGETDLRPTSPYSGAVLKLSKMMDAAPYRTRPDGSFGDPLDMRAAEVAAAVSDAGATGGKLCCALTGAPITHQPAVLIRS